MRVLVVEDEALVAIDLAETLKGMGEQVIGPYLTVATALNAIAAESVEFAVLDFNLRGETSEAIADCLLSLSIPFVFLTGLRRTGLPEKFAKIPLLTKPLNERELSEEIIRAQQPR